MEAVIAEGALEFEESAVTIKERLALLEKKKNELDASIAASQRYLESTPVGMRGSLIDAEGFPKPDMDHYAIRNARHAVDCGKHDVRRINDRMHRLMELYFETQRTAAPPSTATTTTIQVTPAAAASAPLPPMPRPIFRVKSVASQDTPAAEAGLQVGTRIVSFGTVATGDLRAVAALLQSSVGSPVEVTVLGAGPEGEVVLQVLRLVPRPLAAGGLLGCVLEVI